MRIITCQYTSRDQKNNTRTCSERTIFLQTKREHSYAICSPLAAQTVVLRYDCSTHERVTYHVQIQSTKRMPANTRTQYEVKSDNIPK